MGRLTQYIILITLFLMNFFCYAQKSNHFSAGLSGFLYAIKPTSKPALAGETELSSGYLGFGLIPEIGFSHTFREPDTRIFLAYRWTGIDEFIKTFKGKDAEAILPQPFDKTPFSLFLGVSFDIRGNPTTDPVTLPLQRLAVGIGYGNFLFAENPERYIGGLTFMISITAIEISINL